MSEWTWVRNPAVNDIPGRIPTEVLPAFEARGWEVCPEPTDEEQPDAPAPVDEPAPEVKPSASGPKKENDRG